MCDKSKEQQTPNLIFSGKFFTTNGFRMLIENEIERQYQNLTEEELERLGTAFKGTEGEKELKLFVEIRLMEKQFSGVEYWESYNELINALSQYANLTAQWQAQKQAYKVLRFLYPFFQYYRSIRSNPDHTH